MGSSQFYYSRHTFSADDWWPVADEAYRQQGNGPGKTEV
jgi:hypothetical protein